MMRKGSIAVMYKSMPAAEQRTFWVWAKANAIFVAALVGVLLTAATLAPTASSVPQTAAKPAGSTEVSAASARPTQPTLPAR